MFNFSKLTVIALAAAASFKSALSGPADVVSRAAGTNATIASHGTLSPQVNLVQVCMDPNFKNCVDLTFPTIPTGCVGVATGWVHLITSARAIAGLQCTFYADPGCSYLGNSVIVAGEVPDFRPIAMDDLASALSCVSV
ncbi:hypothetical protein DFH09DRAFT_1329206 [Mycena vulgaris]|nr:hypothetical protein DFH09DRAFT_1329206 [Mycena vulgaris]